jgi:hypothetical protein
VSARPTAGLCDGCRHQRLVPNTRGSVFSLCERSRSDERFPRYPPLPVLECPGFEPRPAEPPTPPSGPAPRSD